jgi:uncharacterized protein (TIGR02145 family)
MNFRILVASLLLILNCCGSDNITNPQPVHYESVTIGTQFWMLKNIEVFCYRNGDSIPHVTDPLVWENLRTGAWSYYNNSDSTGKIYGKLYNWHAVNDPRGLAPEGLHVPSDSEWTVLTDFLGGENIAGGKMKEEGTLHWIEPNYKATNESGFTALPGGWYYTSIDIGGYGNWWSSSESDSASAWRRFLFYDHNFIHRYKNVKERGCSIRCIKD